MTRRKSVSGRAFSAARVCRVWAVPRSRRYARAKGTRRTGRPPVLDDTMILALAKTVIAESEAAGFHGEGYKKVHARLRHKGVSIDKERLLRILREHQLLAPVRAGQYRGNRKHEGTIHTDRPDEMWGTDMTTTFVEGLGNAAVFIAVDHCTGELIGAHASGKANRFEAFEPIRQGLSERFGGYAEKVPIGLSIRHDHGSQYMSRWFQKGVRFLGMKSSPNFIRMPEGNGIAELFMRTLKENCL